MTQPFKLLALMAIQSPWHFYNAPNATEDQVPKRKGGIFSILLKVKVMNIQLLRDMSNVHMDA